MGHSLPQPLLRGVQTLAWIGGDQAKSNAISESGKFTVNDVQPAR